MVVSMQSTALLHMPPSLGVLVAFLVLEKELLDHPLGIPGMKTVYLLLGMFL